MLGTRAALPHLKKTKGNIVNLASIAGLVGSQLDPLYSLTKGGVTLFTKSTALEFGRKGYGIRVNSIHPGLIETDMGQKTFVMRAQQVGTNDTEQARKDLEQMRQQMREPRYCIAGHGGPFYLAAPTNALQQWNVPPGVKAREKPTFSTYLVGQQQLLVQALQLG